MKGRAKLRLGGKRTRYELHAEPFDLEGWDELVPVLETYPISGLAHFEGLSELTG